MKVDAQTLDVHNNAEASRFEVQLGDTIGQIEYIKEGETYILVHTEVPPEFGGQGIAERLAHQALETIKAEGAMLMPMCPYVRKYLTKHPEYEPIVIPYP